MNPTSTWLIDKSALVRVGNSPAASTWANRMDRGLVRVAAVTRLEVAYSAQTADAARKGFRAPPLSVMPVEYLTPAIEDRALEVQLLLADKGMHRAPSVPDLLIAATAELSGLIVLHVDKDFGLIAGVTGQRAERLTI